MCEGYFWERVRNWGEVEIKAVKVRLTNCLLPVGAHELGGSEEGEESQSVAVAGDRGFVCEWSIRQPPDAVGSVADSGLASMRMKRADG